MGADVTKMTKLLANEGISHDGVKLHGKGFVITPSQAHFLGVGKRPGLDKHIRQYGNGRDMRNGALKLVIDFFGLSEATVRAQYPEAYQYLLERVRYDLGPDGKPKVNKKGQRTGREWNNRPSYRDNWWIFGEPRSELRPALEGITRYIGTVDTSTNRVFEFIDSEILVDDGVVIVATAAAEVLAILSSRIHVLFSLRAGGWLGVGDDPRWNKSLVFEPFPFPDPTAPCRPWALRPAQRGHPEQIQVVEQPHGLPETNLPLICLHLCNQKGRLANEFRTACGQMITRREAPDFTDFSRNVDFQRQAALHFLTAG